ncbi:MAG: PIN domain-containing protein, partial [Rhodoplanes sp.]
MIGLDTNILVRLVVADDPAQTARAQRFVETRCTPEAPGFINCIVLAELVWVLARAYDYSRAEIAAAVENLLAGDDRVIEHDDEVRDALEIYRSGRGDFVDALILYINRARGCEATATFDRRAAKLNGFV